MNTRDIKIDANKIAFDAIIAALFKEDGKTLRADVVHAARANMAAEGIAIAA